MIAMFLVGWMIPAANAQPYSIAVDPGHGDTDPGAVGCGLQEATVNLNMALKLRDLLIADPDLNVVMTRETNVFITLQGRVDIANDAGVDRFASIHSNSFSGPADGIETYCYTSGSANSFDQRDAIQAEMIATWPLKDRGGKTAGFYVIKNTSMPATLSEMGFITACSTDATYLGSATHLQSAAEAHHRALRQSLGLTGDVVLPTTGAIKGVVFEDQGLGLDDTSVRLPGAFVQISNGGGEVASGTAQTPSGGWEFTVPVGDGTVTASLSGYETGSRTCSVGAGGDTWCSIGLFPIVVQPADPGGPPQDAGVVIDTFMPPQDAGSPDIGAPDIGTPDVGTSDVGTPNVGTPDISSQDVSSQDVSSQDAGSADVSVPDAGQPAGPDTNAGEDTGPFTVVDTGTQEDSGTVGSVVDPDNGCTAGDAPGGGGGLVVIALAMLMLFAGRRRMVRIAAVALLAGCTTPVPSAPLQVETAPIALAGQAHRAIQDVTLTVAPAPRAVELTVISESNGLTVPLACPAGDAVLATNATMSKLVVLEDHSAPRTIVTARRAGWAASWIDAETVAYRAPHQPMHAVPLQSVRLDGATPRTPVHETPGLWVRIVDGEVVIRKGNTERRISPTGDTFCCARLEAAGKIAIFQGATTGSWVYEVESARRIQLGIGVHARANDDGSFVVFERTEDDGHDITRSELVLVDVTSATGDVLATPALAGWPSFAPNGDLLFSAENQLWRAQLR
ncbi:MAG: N-acetylmuramoyl-L-alanine amidase [Myxococcota bacterium]|jgi:N-acetylmuramoyl-L-alanine amidase